MAKTVLPMSANDSFAVVQMERGGNLFEVVVADGLFDIVPDDQHVDLRGLLDRFNQAIGFVKIFARAEQTMLCPDDRTIAFHVRSGRQADFGAAAKHPGKDRDAFGEDDDRFGLHLPEDLGETGAIKSWPSLYCSLSTIRRDVEAMAKKGMLEKVRNGAAKIEGSASESPFIVRESENIEDKRKIAEKARTLLAPGCTMFLDSSTTCAQTIPLLKGLPSLTVITNGIENALLLAHQGIEVHIPSGILSGTNSAVIGSSCLEYIERFSPDFAFLSARGLSEDGFISEATETSRDIKKAMIARAKRVVLLIDASKIGKTYFAETCSLSEIDTLITNGLCHKA